MPVAEIARLQVIRVSDAPWAGALANSATGGVQYAAFGAAASGAVSLTRSSERGFQVRTGVFDVLYKDGAADAIQVKNRHSANGYFEIMCAPGSGVAPLEKSLAKEITSKTSADGVVVQILSHRSGAAFKTTVNFPARAPGLINWKVEVATKSKEVFADADFDALFG